MNRWGISGATAAAVLLVAAVWAATGGGGITAKAKVKLASSGDGSSPASRWGPMRTGTTPPDYGPPCGVVPGAVSGKHPLHAHPGRMSPRMSSAMEADYDWMFCPPSEEDL